MLKKLLPVLLLGLVAAGCSTTTITNLTPKREYRNANGYYPIEAVLHSDQATLRWDSVKTQVLLENEAVPMRPTPLMTNRWETLIQVPPGQRTIYYRIKFEYKSNAFGKPKAESKVSPIQELHIMDR